MRLGGGREGTAALAGLEMAGLEIAGLEIAGLEMAERLLEVERQLAQPGTQQSLDQAVESLEAACRQWPALMACVTDRAVWESLAEQIVRLERLASAGGETLRAMERLNGSARGYTEQGEPVRVEVGPANVDCRG